MMHHGLFIFSGTSDTNLQLVCRVRNVKYAGGATELPYTDTKFEQLAETRRLLLMTEPPEEDSATLEKREREADEEDPLRAAAQAALSGAEGSDAGMALEDEDTEWRTMRLKDLVDLFVRKLEVLEEIRHLVADLHANGHFDFASGVVLEIRPTQRIEAMKRKKVELYQVLADWQNQLREVRSQHYCLNYFVVKHLQTIRDDLRSAERTFFDKGCLPLQDGYVESGTMFNDFCELVGMKLSPQQQAQAQANAQEYQRALAARRGRDGKSAMVDANAVEASALSQLVDDEASAAAKAATEDADKKTSGDAALSQLGTDGGAEGDAKKSAGRSKLPRDLLAEKMGIIDANAILRTFDRILNVGQYISGKRFLEDSLVTIVLTKGAKIQFDDAEESSDEMRTSIRDFVHNLLTAYTQFGAFPRSS